MRSTIAGFHQDDDGYWVAALACGHNHHVRHDPPWQDRRWTLTTEGRARHLGAVLECRKCDSGTARDWPAPA